VRNKIIGLILFLIIGLFIIWTICEMTLLKADALLSALEDQDNDIRLAALHYLAGAGKDECEKVVPVLLKHGMQLGKDVKYTKFTSEPALTLLIMRTYWDRPLPTKTISSRPIAASVILRLGEPGRGALQKLTSDKDLGTTAVELLKNWNSGSRR